MKVCRNCGRSFSEKTVMQIYCCKDCYFGFRKKFLNMTPEEKEKAFPSLRFKCANCGKEVITDSVKRDRRTRFCCAQCERQYWRRVTRHPARENPHVLSGDDQILEVT